MKKWVALFFICFITSIFPQIIISPQFSELKGMEDQQSNTNLFYRIYTYYENPPTYQWSNHIYHWELSSGIDTLFLSDSGIESPPYNYNHWVSDVDYWNNNPAEFIYCGGHTFGPFFEGGAYISRFDGYTNYFGLFWGITDYLDISASNDSLLYAGVYTDGGPGILHSDNGGRIWDSLSTEYEFLSLNPYHENIYFVENASRELFRTTDTGNTYNLVDPESLPDTRFFYDSDAQHIYRKANDKLIVSDNLGEQFSWQTKYSSDSKIFISNDESVSGTIYLADKKNIFISTDYGNNFTPFKTLDRKIIGIYIKPNSNKLYAATKYKIYEITPDTTQIIKSLPIPDDVFDWLPLNLGDIWVWYQEDEDFPDDTLKYFLREEVIGFKELENKIYTKVLVNKNPLDNKDFREGGYSYYRVDSLNGLVYSAHFQNDSTLWFETFLMDLLAEVGDTIPFGYGAILESEEPVIQFGVNSSKRTFRIIPPWGQQFELVKGFGFVNDSVWYPSYHLGRLLGRVINGVVYGDTTVVSVENEEPLAVLNFKLEQNYPNPFNPSTKIKYQIPSVGTRRAVSVQLKVYDVLGNEIATLVNEEKPAGEYEVEFDATGLPSGIYFYQIKAGSFIQAMKMVFLK
jgi:hypothetical protein